MMTLSNKTTKNRCEGCNKFLLLHNKIMTCILCEKIVHAECAKYNFSFNHLLNLWQCLECADMDSQRYNPFSSVHLDKYDPVQMHESNDIAELSRLLNHCKTYNHDSFNKFLSENQELNNTSSALFNNIDGNHSNFDNFVTSVSLWW